MACKAYIEQEGCVVFHSMKMNSSQPEKENLYEQDLGNEKPQLRKRRRETSSQNPSTIDLSVHYNVASKPKKETPTSSFEKSKDEYELIKSPVLPFSILGHTKTSFHFFSTLSHSFPFSENTFIYIKCKLAKPTIEENNVVI
ncbi:hypothetical protein Csa_005523 [Cucumis sativus]|uniref:Uncharacterized protein n=1 Tax=Cucumis sativus TaxID=3659 RepID=A0A0A0KFV0_CUCSA|nr:hypothetical protein Csa_005523 [Cucumis sativus]